MALSTLTRGSDQTADFEGATYKKRSDFALGATLVDTSEILLWPADQGGDGQYYLWGGALPKVVPAGATPSTSGGISPAAWSIAPSSSRVVVTSTIASMKLIDPRRAQMVQTLGYYNAGDLGAGLYRFDGSDTTSADNGGAVHIGLNNSRWKLVHDGEIDIRQFGCRVNAVTDDAAALNQAIAWVVANGGELVHRGGICRLNSTINLPGSFKLKGIGVDTSYRLSMGAQSKYGSYFYFAHTGKGIVLSAATTGQSNTNGLRLYDFGMIRQQPTVAAGWAPTDHDYDIHLSGYGASDMIGLVPLNTTRGIYSEHRANMLGIKGQGFKSFITVDNNYDTVRIEHCHQWPFWDETAIPMAYSRANLRTWTFRRCDNPMMSNCFSYACFVGIFLTNGLGGGAGPSGVTSRLKACNIDIDAAYYGVFCEAEGATAQFTDFTYTGWTATTGSIGIYSVGNAITLEFKGLRITNANDQATFQQGINNIINVSRFWVDSWNTGNTNKGAISVAANCIFTSDGEIRFYKSFGNNAELFEGVGQIRVPLGTRTVAAATSDGSGNIVVSHGLDVQPQQVFIGSANTVPYKFDVISRTSTTFTVRVSNPAGAAATGVTVSFFWRAEYNT